MFLAKAPTRTDQERKMLDQLASVIRGDFAPPPQLESGEEEELAATDARFEER
jgi:hypothetical protein